MALFLPVGCFLLCPIVQSTIAGGVLVGLIEGADIMLQRFVPPPIPAEEHVPVEALAATPAVLAGVPAAAANPGAMAEDARASSPGWFGGFGFFVGRKEKEEGGGVKTKIWRALIRPIHLLCLLLIRSRPKAVPWVHGGPDYDSSSSDLG